MSRHQTSGHTPERSQSQGRRRSVQLQHDPRDAHYQYSYATAASGPSGSFPEESAISSSSAQYQTVIQQPVYTAAFHQPHDTTVVQQIPPNPQWDPRSAEMANYAQRPYTHHNLSAFEGFSHQPSAYDSRDPRNGHGQSVPTHNAYNRDQPLPFHNETQVGPPSYTRQPPPQSDAYSSYNNVPSGHMALPPIHPTPAANQAIPFGAPVPASAPSNPPIAPYGYTAVPPPIQPIPQQQPLHQPQPTYPYQTLPPPHIPVSNDQQAPSPPATSRPPSRPTEDRAESHLCPEPGCSARAFSTFGNLRRHIREQHGDAKRFACPRCHQTFTRSTARDNHVRDSRCRPRPGEPWQ